MQPGETIIVKIQRHPIGIITNYVVSGFIIVLVVVLLFGVAPRLNTNSSGQIEQGAGIIVLIVLVASTIFNLIATKVYWGNRWIVTSDSITQIEQTGLFSTQSSQLSMENIEDVTAEKNGILTHLFNFGVLKVETAGHHGKFNFDYCPNPNFYAQKILAAREAFDLRGHSQRSQQPSTPTQPSN